MFHLTRFTMRQIPFLLLDCNNNSSSSSSAPSHLPRLVEVSGFSLLGDNAVVCFFKDSKEYCLYNLNTRSLVRKFHFTTMPFRSFMGKNCIWSITASMSVHRLA